MVASTQTRGHSSMAGRGPGHPALLHILGSAGQSVGNIRDNFAKAGTCQVHVRALSNHSRQAVVLWTMCRPCSAGPSVRGPLGLVENLLLHVPAVSPGASPPPRTTPAPRRDPRQRWPAPADPVLPPAGHY